MLFQGLFTSLKIYMHHIKRNLLNLNLMKLLLLTYYYLRVIQRVFISHNHIILGEMFHYIVKQCFFVHSIQLISLHLVTVEIFSTRWLELISWDLLSSNFILIGPLEEGLKIGKMHLHILFTDNYTSKLELKQVIRKESFINSCNF